MKKFLFILLAVALLLGGCSGSSDDITVGEDGVIDIGERLFVTRITDIRLNADHYLGQSIRLEGMFSGVFWGPTENYYHFVTRRSYGCCGDDGSVGFEIYLGDFDPLPDNSWVEVTGVLERVELDNMTILRLAVTSLIELEERGAEFVSN